MSVQLKQVLPFAVFAIALLSLLFTNCVDDKPKGCGPVEFSKENTVTIRLPAAVASFNPLLAKSGYDGYVFGQIFQTLALVEPQTLELVPLMIKKIPAIRTITSGPHAGSLAYDFEFLENASWDNGTPVTANDMIFTLKLIFHPLLPAGGAYRSYFQFLQDIETDPSDPKKFTAYFSKFYLLALESLCQIAVYPAYAYDSENQLGNIPLKDLLDAGRAQQLIASNPGLTAMAEAFQSPRFINDKNTISGSGPYRLESYDPDQGCVLLKKQNWWGDRNITVNPYLAAFPEKLVYRFMKEEGAIENLIRSGGLDLIPDLPASKFLDLKKDSCLALRYDFSTRGNTSYGRLMPNHTRPKLADKGVRRALAHAIDYDYIIKTIYKGFADRIVGPINPSKPYYATNIKPYDYDIEKAKTFLTASGWKDSNGNGIVDKTINGENQELELDLIFGASRVSKEIANSIATTARNAGIKINVVEKDISLMKGIGERGEFDLILNSPTLFPGWVDIYQTHHTKSIGLGNRMFYSNPALDALIDSIRTEPDEDKRTGLYIKMQQAIYDDLPEIYLFTALQRVVVSKRFNYVLSPNRPGYYEQFFRVLQ